MFWMKGVYIEVEKNKKNVKEREDIRQWMEAARQGDAHACGVLVEQCGRRMFSLVQQMGLNTLDAEEVTQDALMRGLQQLQHYNPTRASLATWFCRIAYRTALNRLRKAEVVTLSVDEDETVTLETDRQMVRLFQEPDNSRVEQLQQALEQLTPDEQTLITLFYYDDLPIGDIAYITEQTSNAVAVRLHRIRKKLYEHIQNLSS